MLTSREAERRAPHRHGFGPAKTGPVAASGRVLLLAIVCLSVCGCQRQLMPTPHLYAYAGDDGIERVPETFRSNVVDVLYVTDRVPEGEGKTGVTYGYGRSHSLAYGACEVEIGRDLSWEELERASRTSRRKVSLPLSVRQVRELGRLPEVPYPIVETGPPPVEDPAVVAASAKVVAALHEELAARLSRSERKHVYIYVHGFNNTFEDAVLTTAELWHFLGRQGVAICYTWPAGRGLSGRGYTYDTVSSEFTVFHLKQMLRFLGRCPEVEKVHILAHSRGTDVATSAARELLIEYTHADRSAREALKLGNLILAAPDLDFDVVQQRLAGDRVGYLPERGTIYASASDRALALADIMTLGMTRLGQLQPSALTPRLKKMVEMSPICFVEALVHTGFLGHSYFLDSPAVSSDVILLLRDNRPPGAEHGRPLEKRMTNFYALRDDYLKQP